MSERFVVRKATSDLGYVYWRLWDTAERRFVLTTTREAEAESCARRLDRAARAEAVHRAEAGTW